MSNEYVCERLNEKCDYRATARLIYQTDPYIYSDLFGNEENACQILACSFDNPKSIFHKNAIYIAKHHSDVVGCVMAHDNEFKWDQAGILQDFEKAEICPPESFFSASKYMDKTYNNRRLGNNICNVCVRSDYRHKGVGTFLLGSVLRFAKGQFIELTVLQDNIAAIGLYQKSGFQIIGEPFEDYGGYNQPTVYSLKMIYNG